jgi:ABC-type antimicrobial peptide transport system ATPase subunit
LLPLYYLERRKKKNEVLVFAGHSFIDFQSSIECLETLQAVQAKQNKTFKARCWKLKHLMKDCVIGLLHNKVKARS